MKPNESQTELIITRTSTNNRRINHVPSVPIPDKHFVVELPQEVDDSNPPAYPNFCPPSYEEAFEMFKKSHLIIHALEEDSIKLVQVRLSLVDFKRESSSKTHRRNC